MVQHNDEDNCFYKVEIGKHDSILMYHSDFNLKKNELFGEIEDTGGYVILKIEDKELHLDYAQIEELHLLLQEYMRQSSKLKITRFKEIE